jgi:hypothetical protein
LTDERRVTFLAVLVSITAFAVVYLSGTILYFGDAVAHLNIARKILDSKSPGWLQLGTVWLPLPHLLTALTVWIDPLWRSGAAGALPSMAGFVFGVVFLFRIARRELESSPLAWAALALYTLNLNLLYLQSTPLNEAQMIACLLGAVWYAGEGRAVPAGLWLMAGTLTRYDAWFYIPFIAAYLFWKYGLRRALVFASVASLGPLFWLIHNQALYGNALEWYNGPYAPAAIAARTNPGRIGTRYPGDHDLWTALIYYWKAVRLTAGNVPAWLAVAGSAMVIWRRRAFSSVLLLWLPMLFYTASIAYGSVPLFIPQWWPRTYYNTRYALHLLPALAALAPAVFLPLSRWRRQAALALVLFVAAGWALGYSKSRSDAVIVFREAQENSQDRRLAVNILAKYISPGCQEIWMGGGDWTGALTESGIPFRRVIHDGNRALWKQVKLHPESMVDCVVEQQGDGADEAIAKLPSFEQSFRVVLNFTAPGESRLRLWRRR